MPCAIVSADTDGARHFADPGLNYAEWNCESLSATVVYAASSAKFGAWKSWRQRKSIVVIVSPLEAFMLDVAEAFTASHANFVSQHHSFGLPCYSLFKSSARSSSGALQSTIKWPLRY